MQRGYATPVATQAWRTHHSAHIHPSQWREVDGCTISPLGLGTYLGSADAETYSQTVAAILHFLKRGGNIIDSAINYRWQASERAIGEALGRAVTAGVPREAIYISTKGGFLPGDFTTGQDMRAYVETKLIEPGIITADDIVAGCHCMTPAYLNHQIQESRCNLQLDTIDLYYLHNPETQLEEVSQTVFQERLAAAFATLEEAVVKGWIRSYGVATWEALRVPPTNKIHMSIEELLSIAKTVGGRGHHFRAVQLPLSLLMPEAVAKGTQRGRGELLPAVAAASAAEISVMVSAPLMQSRLTRGLPKEMAGAFAGLSSDAARSLSFVMNAPGVTAAMCGMKQVAHIDENWEAATHALHSPEAWVAAVGKL